MSHHITCRNIHSLLQVKDLHNRGNKCMSLNSGKIRIREVPFYALNRRSKYVASILLPATQYLGHSSSRISSTEAIKCNTLTAQGWAILLLQEKRDSHLLNVKLGPSCYTLVNLPQCSHTGQICFLRPSQYQACRILYLLCRNAYPHILSPLCL